MLASADRLRCQLTTVRMPFPPTAADTTERNPLPSVTTNAPSFKPSFPPDKAGNQHASGKGDAYSAFYSHFPVGYGTASGTDVYDTASGTDAQDTATGSDVQDTASGTIVHDTASGTDVHDTASGTDAQDTATGTDAQDTASSTVVQDTASSTVVHDTASGTDAQDTASGTDAQDTTIGTDSISADCLMDALIVNSANANQLVTFADSLRYQLLAAARSSPPTVSNAACPHSASSVTANLPSLKPPFPPDKAGNHASGRCDTLSVCILNSHLPMSQETFSGMDKNTASGTGPVSIDRLREALLINRAYAEQMVAVADSLRCQLATARSSPPSTAGNVVDLNLAPFQPQTSSGKSGNNVMSGGGDDIPGCDHHLPVFQDKTSGADIESEVETTDNPPINEKGESLPESERQPPVFHTKRTDNSYNANVASEFYTTDFNEGGGAALPISGHRHNDPQYEKSLSSVEALWGDLASKRSYSDELLAFANTLRTKLAIAVPHVLNYAVIRNLTAQILKSKPYALPDIQDLIRAEDLEGIKKKLAELMVDEELRATYLRRWLIEELCNVALKEAPQVLGAPD
ncbi:Hypp8366 [Branchiostoma lanceolatum]|uniref:Hypp8366 protein n=1 Tax=Branchiostoma lanceolatum TaxID=7740 RepID=A0A8J9Z6K6_BRALA|nr:Hypp8366 [Branchiostoma lanceolatum]